MPTRRHLLGAGGLLLAGLGFRATRAEAPVVEIRMRGDEEGARVGFDPVGLLLRPGQTVRWRCEANYHTITAYHPDNGHHSLRIPRGARPWASEVLLPGESFEVTFTAEGVYDHFCAPHEHAGMVGRLIVGQPTGPGSQPFDWFKGSVEGRDWLAVPRAARAAFPSAAEIMARQVIPSRAV